MDTNNSLTYFLGNTIEEAKETHDQFVGIINKIAREYSLSTGIDKKELFNEAFIALSKAKNNYIEKEGPFKGYAICSIKRHLNDYIRDNSIIAIPQYMYRTIKLLNRLEQLLLANGYSVSGTDHLLYKKTLIIKEEDYHSYNKIITFLKNIADRANISLEKLLKRTVYIPNIVEDTKIDIVEPKKTETYLTIMVNNIIEELTTEEKVIVMYLMEGRSKKQIAEELKKSDTWVNNKMKKIKQKALKLMEV